MNTKTKIAKKTMGDRIRLCRVWAAPVDTTERDSATGLPVLSLSECSLLLKGSPGAVRRHLGMLESGKRTRPQISMVRDIATLFGVSLDWLILGAGPQPDPAAVKARVQRAREGAARAIRAAMKQTGTDG